MYRFFLFSRFLIISSKTPKKVFNTQKYTTHSPFPTLYFLIPVPHKRLRTRKYKIF